MYLLTKILGCRHLLFVLLLLAFFILFPVLTVHGAQPVDFNDDERDDFSTTAAAKPLSTNTELLTTEISLPDSADPATTTTESSTSGLSAPPPPLSLSPPLSSAETVGSCPTIAGFDLAFINRTTSKLLSLANSAAEEADEVCEVDRLLDQLLPPGYEPAVNFDLGQAIRVEHINQTLATADRLLTLISNYSQTFAPLNTRVLNRFSYLLLGLPLSSKCMSSLLAISGAIRRRELWAMKCELRICNLKIFLILASFFVLTSPRRHRKTASRRPRRRLQRRRRLQAVSEHSKSFSSVFVSISES